MLGFGFMLGANAGQLELFKGDPTPPSLVLEDINGKRHRLSGYHGKVVLLNFWATWCPPCRAEMPAIWRLGNQLEYKNFQVITVNIGEEKEVIRAFMPKRMQKDFVVLMAKDMEPLQHWRPIYYPTTYIIDSGGKIRYRIYGALEWDKPEVVKKIRALLP